MAEISQAGYQLLRGYIQSNWNYIELQDENNARVIRVSTADSRCTWTHTAGDRTLKLQLVISGSDTEITLPKTVTKSVIYNVATGGNAISTESFAPFTFESNEDELTVIHNIEVPKV